MSHMNSKVLHEAKRLYSLGYAIHWLHPNSKRPVESGWTTGPRKEWSQLQASYSEPLNVGVRLGRASKIDGKGYLAVVDVDVKSTEEHHRKEAIQAAKKILGGASCPVVLSGRGNGSRHYHCVTPKPFKPFDAAKSEETVKVFMPSSKPSKRELEQLTPAEIKGGMRLRAAWEISIMSDGRQVVLPPSIHPDSNKPYVWHKNIGSIASLPSISFDGIKPDDADDADERVQETNLPLNLKQTGKKAEPFTFEPVGIVLDWLEVSDKIKKGIVSGEGVEDRSAFLLPACTALLSAGCSRDEILTLLTDRKTFLGACAYEHAQTKDRRCAARWLWRYTLKKVMEERAAEKAFSDASELEERKLSKDEKEKQSKEFEAEIDWRDSLDKTQKGQYRPTYNNCRAILLNVCGQPNVLGRDEFAVNDYYLCDAPWRSKKGRAVTDIDVIRFKSYCAENFGVEFNDRTIDQCFQEIADLNRYHPVQDWIRGLKWDGVERADTWLKDFAGAQGPEPYLSDVSRKFLVAMVARVFQPGVKFDTMLILEGNQGTGKSTLLSRLAGEPWFTDASLIIGDKDSVLTIQSKWLVELGELSAMSKADLEAFKAFVSQRTDRIRAPYGKRVEEFPRQNVFAGTTNLDEYLRDLTGNRRYWVVKLFAEQIDFEGISKIRDQLFAEAYAMYRLGEELYLTGKAETQARGEQDKRLQGDEWMPMVQEIVESDDFPRESFEIRDVANRMAQVGAHKLSVPDGHRIGKCLRMLGFEKFQEKTGRRRKLWRIGTLPNPSGTLPRVPEITNENADLSESEPWNSDF